jgi:hypothetical protein
MITIVEIREKCLGRGPTCKRLVYCQKCQKEGEKILAEFNTLNVNI